MIIKYASIYNLVFKQQSEIFYLLEAQFKILSFSQKNLENTKTEILTRDPDNMLS